MSDQITVSKVVWDELIAMKEENGKVKKQLKECQESLKSVLAIQQFRALIESLEYQFTANAPQFINQNTMNRNPTVKFNTRVEKWKWILEYSTDPRAKLISQKLKAFNAEDHFCVLVSSLYMNCSKAIHLPGSKQLQPHEVYEELVNNEIAVDGWSKSAIRIILYDIGSIPLFNPASSNPASSNP